MSKIFNLYVRFEDESSDRGWTPIWFANAPTFQKAMEILKNPNLDNFDKNHILALTVNDDGGVYDPKEKTLALGRIVPDVGVGIISDDDFTVPMDFMPNVRSYVIGFSSWKGFWDKNYIPTEIIDVIDRTRKDEGRLIAGLSAYVLSEVVNLCTTGEFQIEKDANIENNINLGIAYSRYEISEEDFVFNMKNSRVLRVLDARKPQTIDFLRRASEYIEAVDHRSVSISIDALRSYYGYDYNRDEINSDVVHVIKQHVTLAMILEDAFFDI